MFENIRNTIDFFIRNKIRLSRKNFLETSQDAIKRNRLENLYTKNVLERFFEKQKTTNVRILDIGCKNWFYAKGEYEFFDSFCSDFILDGVEIDAFRLYSNFYSRYETAKYYTKGLKNTNYICANLLDIKEKYDYIIWFLPFVLKEPHQYWGLPDNLFYPKKLLSYAYSLLNENGQLLIINQGKIEAEEQKKLLSELKLEYRELGEIKSEHFQYKNQRYGFLLQK